MAGVEMRRREVWGGAAAVMAVAAGGEKKEEDVDPTICICRVELKRVLV
jgi:hypothetical protein